ncbi:MAG: hypothetical protein V1781_06240 [Bacteroidota bacterium]
MADFDPPPQSIISLARHGGLDPPPQSIISLVRHGGLDPPSIKNHYQFLL